MRADSFVERGSTFPFASAPSSVTQSNCPEQLPRPLGSGLLSPVEFGRAAAVGLPAVTTFISSAERCRFIRVCQRISVEADDLAQLMGRGEASLYRCVLSTGRRAKQPSFQDDSSPSQSHLLRMHDAMFTSAGAKKLLPSLIQDIRGSLYWENSPVCPEQH